VVVAGSKASTPNASAPRNPAASRRLPTTDAVVVDGITLIATRCPAARATIARHCCSRLASA
jgi:hypothetical protein